MTTTSVVDFDSFAPRVEKALRKLVGSNAAIDLKPGFEGRVRVKVISPLFNGMTEAEKGGTVWDVLKRELKEEEEFISYVIPYSTDEL